MRATAGYRARIGAAATGKASLSIFALAGLLCVLVGPAPAQAVTLNVIPKNEQTMMRAPDGKISPGKFKYRLSVSNGRKARWKLVKVPRWLVAEPVKGHAKRKKSVVVFSANKKIIKRQEAGIYATRIKFRYKDGGEVIRVSRNVTLIVEGSPSAGADVFNAKCIGCHDLDYNKNGPYLRDVYGRKAGTTDGFDHSDALIAYGKIWEERNLNDWLTNPQKLVKGADMYLSLKKAEDRMNVISFLKAYAP
jgi:cytochrome c